MSSTPRQQSWIVIHPPGVAAAEHDRLAIFDHPAKDTLAQLRLGSAPDETWVSYAAGPPSGDFLDFRTLPPNHPDRDLFAKALASRDHCLGAVYSTTTGAPILRLGGDLVATTAAGEQIFPRIDPAVMVLITSLDQGSVLLANNAAWTEPRFSLVAGFVEAGESLEAACQRECEEELGISIAPGDFRYAMSDVWPYPRSLMVGFTASQSTDVALRYVDGEIREARWFSRDEVVAAIGKPGEFFLPPVGSLAQRMISAWTERQGSHA